MEVCTTGACVPMPGDVFRLERNRGPVLFAYCLDVFLYGILTVQTYLYFLAFPNDKRVTKIIVYFLYIVGTAQTAFALRDLYFLFCTGTIVDGSFISSDRAIISYTHSFGFMWLTIPTASAIVAIVVQFLYAYRIYTISGQKLITVVVSLLALAQFILGIYSAITVYFPAVHKSFTTSIRAPYINALAWGLVGALCDILIAGYMFYFLSKQMKGVSRRTQTPLTKIKRLVLETGMLTAAMAIAYTVTSVLSMRGSGNWYMIPGLSLSKLYANSMLVLLNNRFTILGGRNSPDPSHRHSSVAGTDARMTGIAFVHSHPEDTIFLGGGIHTVDLAPQPNHEQEEINNVKPKDEHIQEV